MVIRRVRLLMIPISAARILIICGAFALTLRAGGSLIPILAPRYYATGNYGRAYDAPVQAGRRRWIARGTSISWMAPTKQSSAK